MKVTLEKGSPWSRFEFKWIIRFKTLHAGASFSVTQQLVFNTNSVWLLHHSENALLFNWELKIQMRLGCELIRQLCLMPYKEHHDVENGTLNDLSMMETAWMRRNAPARTVRRASVLLQGSTSECYQIVLPYHPSTTWRLVLWKAFGLLPGISITSCND